MRAILSEERRTHRVGVGAVLLSTFTAAVVSANIYIYKERERERKRCKEDVEVGVKKRKKKGNEEVAKVGDLIGEGELHKAVRNLIAWIVKALRTRQRA